jgi:prepilin-type N-terminal cleavage/methylation domain-containing protein
MSHIHYRCLRFTQNNSFPQRKSMTKVDRENMKNTSSQSGFSLAEVLVVIVVLAILACMAVMSFWNFRKYSADDQAKKIVDIFDEARQKALNQRKTFRVEINRTTQEVRLIDEGSDASTAADDVILKRVLISGQVLIGAAPPNVSGAPTATTPINVPTYATSTYPLSSGDDKITLRFKRNGQVVDAGTDNIGTGSLMNGATIYIYSRTPSVSNPDVIRAVTVLGTTGDTSLYKCRFTSSTCGGWSR